MLVCEDDVCYSMTLTHMDRETGLENVRQGQHPQSWLHMGSQHHRVLLLLAGFFVVCAAALEFVPARLAASGVNISAAATTVTVGSATKLSTDAAGWSSCFISGGVYGTGQQVTLPRWSGSSGTISRATTFTLLCTDASGGSAAASVTVRLQSALPDTTTVPPAVTPPQSPAPVPTSTVPTTANPIVFTAASSTVYQKTSTKLSLVTSGMSTCVISGGAYGSGQETLVPRWSGSTGVLSKNTTFRIACTTTGGTSKSASVTVQVLASTTPPASVSTTTPATPTATSTTATTTATTSVATKLISSAHRFAPSMFGGWGEHLGHLLRAADATLWFVDDTGNDVNSDPALAYYHQVNGSWKSAGSLALSGTVQQNTGSVMSGSTIYTYGIDVSSHKVEECWFNAKAGTPGGCNMLPFTTGNLGNYVGAVISPNGTRVVWWVDVRTSWQYAYNAGSGWNGPFTSPLPGYTDISYAYGSIDKKGHIEFVASASKGATAADGYDVLIGSTNVGVPVTNWSLLQSAHIAGDIYIDPHGGVHMLTAPGASYFYKSAQGALKAGGVLDAKAGTAHFVVANDVLHVVYSHGDGTLWEQTVPVADVSGAISWKTRPMQQLQIGLKIGSITLYPESYRYQTTAPGGLNIGLNGYSKQGFVYHLFGQ